MGILKHVEIQEKLNQQISLLHPVLKFFLHEKVTFPANFAENHIQKIGELFCFVIKGDKISLWRHLARRINNKSNIAAEEVYDPNLILIVPVAS